jgi:prophage antirepressor-like protein
MELIKNIDETFCFEKKEVRVIGTYNEPRFVAKDICDILELKNITEAIRNIPEKWRTSEILKCVNGQNMNMITLLEPAVYMFIMRSNKPIAKNFQEFVCEDILPSIRKSGEFKLQKMLEEKEKEKLQLLEEKIKIEKEKADKEEEIEELKLRMDKKTKQKYEKKNCVYILSNKLYPEGFFCYGETKDLTSRLQNYIGGSPIPYTVEYAAKVRNKATQCIVEKLVFEILNMYRVPNNQKQAREWFYGVDIKTIKTEIESCIDYIDKRRKIYENIKYEHPKEIFQMVLDEKFELKEKNKFGNNSIKQNKNDINSDSDNDSEDENNDSEDDENENNDGSKNEKQSLNEVVLDCETTAEIKSDKDSDDEFIIIDDSESDEVKNVVIEETKKASTKTLKVKKESIYNVDLSNIGVVPNDPLNFQKFLDDCCDLSDTNSNGIMTHVYGAYRIWSRSIEKEHKTKFYEFMNGKFKEARCFIDHHNRHVWKGVNLKPFEYKKNDKNFDFEQFIEEKCKVNWFYRISYVDFFEFFSKWKKEKDPSFQRFTRPEEEKMKQILELSFAKGRIAQSVTSKTINLFGMLGIGCEENGFGDVEELSRPPNRKVQEYDSKTHEKLRLFESLNHGAHALRIPHRTFSEKVRLKSSIKDKYYLLLD